MPGGVESTQFGSRIVAPVATERRMLAPWRRVNGSRDARSAGGAQATSHDFACYVALGRS